MKTTRLPHIFYTAFVVAAITFVVLTLAVCAHAQTETALYSFTGKDGSGPAGRLVFDAAGNLYGTTVRGGAFDAGSVFQLTPTSGGWLETVLFSFDGNREGANPWGGVVIDAAGNLYGTTYFGGLRGSGTVFTLKHGSSGWTESVIHHFTGSLDGGNPNAGLVWDAAGNLYGTTVNGGRGTGVVFSLAPSSTNWTGWQETVLHAFTGGRDGAHPYSSVVLDAAGNVYGTASTSGSKGNGVVFKIFRNSGGVWTESVLHAFAGGADGAQPWAGMVLDAAGNLYGTTLNGGQVGSCSNFGCGTVFQLKPNSSGNWIENILYSFTGKTDGAYPYAGLTIDAAGNLYGATYYSGDLNTCSSAGCGVVYKLAHPSGGHWTQSLLYTFSGQADGATPYSAPILDAAGNLYGVTLAGGATQMGVVYEITP